MPNRYSHLKSLKHHALTVGLFCVSLSCQGGDLYFIANANVKDVKVGDARDIYLGKKQFAGAVPLKPVDNAAQQTDFLQSVLNMEKGKYTGWWVKKTFQEGLHQPDNKSGDSEVIQYVLTTPGAVGYVAGTPPGNVSTIGKF